jgi:hypothetical protein
MPILTQPASRSPRRRPWLWVVLVVPGVLFLLLVGLVAWSWNEPVQFSIPVHFVLPTRTGPCIGSRGGWHGTILVDGVVSYATGDTSEEGQARLASTLLLLLRALGTGEITEHVAN